MPVSLLPSPKSQTPSPALEELLIGTSRHGYDPLKPRKPLSRIAIGKAFDANKAEQQAAVGFLNWKAALVLLVLVLV